MQIFINRPDELLKQVWNDKNIHIVEKEHVLGKDNFCLIDISMNGEGMDEDKMYIDSAFYRENIRRGNTLVECVDSKGKKKVMWGRKGVEKIIDIRLQYIESVTRNLQLNKEQKKSFDYIFRNVNRCLQQGKRVELVKTQKANGQNAQISYFYELDAWIICSKNVSMIASSLSDLQIYQGKRYTYAKAIARQWFKEIQHLNKEKLKKLKTRLDGYTLVGQYCGNPQYQHLILYNKIRIIWFALIDNFTQEYCLDPFEVKKDIEQFGLKFVKIKRMGSWNDKKKFYQELEDLYLKVAQASMEDHQYGLEGSIVYILSPQFKDNKPHTKVLGSGKLKTIEYRFFRKIRQKLSRYINRKQTQPQLIRKYQLQCEQLQKSNYSPAPYPQYYYTQILKKGCQLIRETKISQQFLRSRFVSILKLLFYVISKNISLKSFGNKLIKNHQFLEEVTKIPLKTFGTLGCSMKVVYVAIDLPGVLGGRASEELAQQFNKLKLKFNTINCEKSTNIVEKIFTQINNSSAGKQKTPLLMHFYINDTLQIHQILKLISKLKYKGKKDVYHQVVLIVDQVSPPELFEDANHHEYPFKLQTILLSYWKAYQEVKSTPTIREKIDVLKNITEVLKLRRDIMRDVEKNRLKKFEMKMSGQIKLQQNQKTQISKIISSIVNSQKQYQNYCRLIIKLGKYTQETFSQLDKSQFEAQVKNLIKCCFTTVPQIDFTQKS